MWQPSLNISTVLTSIGLLLSEPNPDDGLMHEASRDYKYNRQAFDQTARSMTEKYAQMGVTHVARAENESAGHMYKSTSQQTKMEGSVESVFIPNHMRLPLEYPGCSNNTSDSAEEISKAAVHDITKNHIEIEPMKEASKYSSKYTWNFSTLRSTRFKLSTKVPVATHSRNGESENTRMLNQCSPVLEIQTTSDFSESSVQCKMASISNKGCVENNHIISSGKGLQSLHHDRIGSVRPQEGLLLSLNSNSDKTNPPKDAIARKGNCSTSIRFKKKGLVGSKPPSESSGHRHTHLIDDKENFPPMRCLPQLTDQTAASAVTSSVIPKSGMCGETKKISVIAASKLSETTVKLPQETLNQPLGSNNNVIQHPKNDDRCDIEVCDGKGINTFDELAEGSQATDAVIVLDSEDSDDDNVKVRSKLSLAKRCWLRKRKFGL